MTERLRITGLFRMPRWATIGLLGVLLLGVLAMHGLASHYSTGDVHGEIGATASIPDLSSPGGMSPADTCEAPACHEGGDDSHSGLLTLCMAVLVGIAVVLILTVVVTRHSALSRWTSLRQPVKQVRLGGPDPPTLYQLSLLRC
jgi:hypothetical protein